MPPGPPGVGPTGPSPGKSSGFGIDATSPTPPFAPLALFAPVPESPRFGSSFATTACTAANASGATATAHWETKRICSGAAVAATSTMAATVFTSAFDASIADFTISQAQAGAVATSAETISRTFDCSPATAFLTERESATQSTAVLADNNPKEALNRAKKAVFFILKIRW